MGTKISFGKKDCSQIEVEPFSGICDFTAPGGSTPMTLDVPVPSFAHTLPPNECACFEFTGKEGSGTVTPNCSTTQASAKVTVNITQADATDCCTGKYNVTPTVELDMPCIAFTVDEATKDNTLVTLHNRSGNAGNGYDGNISVRTDISCCKLVPHIDLTVPDCKKKYVEFATNQITCCDRGTTVSKKLLEMKYDEDTCSVYPVLTPIELPCCSLPDDSTDVTFPVDNNGSTVTLTLKRENCVNTLTPTYDIKDPPCACLSFTATQSNINFTSDKTPTGTCKVEIARVGDCCDYSYKITPSINIPSCMLANKSIGDTINLTSNGTGSLTWKMTRNDCDIGLEMSVTPITLPSVPSYCPPEVSTTGVTLNVSYKGKDSEGKEKTETKKIANFLQFSSGTTKSGCPLYTPALATLDLTMLEGGSAEITSGGDVYQDSDTKKLYIDGTGHATTTWYGGGYGDLKTDNPTSQFSRGEIARNMVSPYGYVSNQNPIPAASINAQRILTASRSYNTKWMSRREDSEEQSGYATGNLSMYMPTGAQWHTRGTALVMTHFMFNDSGVLSYMNEPGEDGTSAAILLAPAPAVLKSDNSKNASGLSVLPGDWTSSTCKITSGLAVKAGGGIRLYGVGDSSHSSSDTYDSTNRQGEVEIQYGAGFRIIKDSTKTTSAEKYLNYPVSVNDSIVPNFGRGLSLHAIDTTVRNGKLEIKNNSYDFMFYCSDKATTTTADNEENGKLSFCDTTNTADVFGGTNDYSDLSSYTGYTACRLGHKWHRTRAQDSSRGNDIIIPILFNLSFDATTKEPSCQHGWLRFTSSGLLLGLWSNASKNAAPWGLPTQANWDTFRSTSTNILEA